MVYGFSHTFSVTTWNAKSCGGGGGEEEEEEKEEGDDDDDDDDSNNNFGIDVTDVNKTPLLQFIFIVSCRGN